MIPDGPALVIGLGVTGEAVARTLRRSGRDVVVVEDHPRDEHRTTAESLGVTLVEAPDAARLEAAVRAVSVAFPSPGIPDSHAAFPLLGAHRVEVRSEFDLAASIDDRPLVAITGTDGKTTVTTMVTAMLEASGRRAMAAGNTETPLVEAVADGTPEIFVVEASSFRLGHTHRFVPAVATWLNFGPDHLDVHATPQAYERAKARIWDDLGRDQVAVANVDDEVVMRHVRSEVPSVTFGRTGDYRVRDGVLLGSSGAEILPVSELSRSLPHDVANALAAAATAEHAGATVEGVREVLRSFEHLAHRVQLVTEIEGIAWYDDSKATTPHAAIAATRGFPSVVLIAGGRNKGLDLSALREVAAQLRAVVAIGEAAGEVEGAFEGLVAVQRADDMAAAVDAARDLARPGDTVLLSPACASFDQYGSYAERGDDFARLVRALDPGVPA